MPYGTDPFVDGYGDYKQPTVVDYDLLVNNTHGNKPYSSTPEEKQKILDQFEADQKTILDEILLINPIHGGVKYQNITFAKDGKLAWDIAKINNLKADVDWLYNLRRTLVKNQAVFLLRR